MSGCAARRASIGTAAALLVVAAACSDARRTPARLPPIDLRAHAEPASWTELPAFGTLPRRTDPRTGIVFVLVPAGEFTMGGTSPIDSPQHRVAITQPFWIADAEVTVAQWRTFVLRDDEGHLLSDAFDLDAPRGPVTGVSWDDAQAFCKPYGYALPTEAQWEYACRGNAIDREAPWRDRRTLEGHAWVYTNAAGQAHLVATRDPNGFGLHDMLGNVWEWTADWFGQGHAVTDPTQ